MADYDDIVIDRCADIDSIPYPLGTKEDLDETVRLVQAPWPARKPATSPAPRYRSMPVMR